MSASWSCFIPWLAWNVGMNVKYPELHIQFSFTVKLNNVLITISNAWSKLLLATYFGSQVISASDGTEVSKADSKFSKTTFAGQVLSNWKWLMTSPSRSSSAFAAPLTMLSLGVFNKTTSLEKVQVFGYFPFPPWVDWLRLPPLLHGWRPRAAGCLNSSRGVREFTDPPEDDGAANPEDEATAPPEQVEGTLEEVPVFTACLKSGCSIICLTRLSKLLAVEESRVFAMFQYGANGAWSMENHGAC